jgi:hypothetical protein
MSSSGFADVAAAASSDSPSRFGLDSSPRLLPSRVEDRWRGDRERERDERLLRLCGEERAEGDPWRERRDDDDDGGGGGERDDAARRERRSERE